VGSSVGSLVGSDVGSLVGSSVGGFSRGAGGVTSSVGLPPIPSSPPPGRGSGGVTSSVGLGSSSPP